MTIHYSPSYTGHIYIDFAKLDNGLAFDCCYKNTEGLMDLLATFLGVHLQDHSTNERLTKYYAAFAQYIENNPDCIFAASFSNAALATAQECLRWRDELTMYGWNADTPAPSERLRVLADVERLFDCPGKGEFYSKIVTALAEHKDVLKGSRIVVPFRREILPPMVQAVLALLEEGDCTVECEDDSKHNYERLLKSKETFEVWDFETQQEALQYLASLEDNDVDAFVCRDNHLLDIWKHLSGAPTSGSKTTDRYPQASQILMLGVKLLSTPLDVEALVHWLQLPQHPLPRLLCYKLAKAIVKTGGYYNQECKAVLEENASGKKELEWLPEMVENPVATPSAIEVEAIREYVARLMKWGKKQLAINEENATYYGQLLDVCDALSALLDVQAETIIDNDILEGWLSSLILPNENVQYDALVGSGEVVGSPAGIVGNAGTVVICDAYGACNEILSCAFLTDKEYKALSEHLTLWKKDAERAYNRAVMMYPLAHTRNKLIAVVCHKNGSETLAKYPLIIWAEGILGDDFKQHVEKKRLDKKLFCQKDVVDNHTDESIIEIKNAALLEWPEKESPTALEKLVDSPLDYTLERLVNINDSQDAVLPLLSQTVGNVAHAVIADLFAPEEGEASCNAATISQRVANGFDDALQKAICQRGAILLQKVNAVVKVQFEIKLRRCIAQLLEIIEVNQLAVVNCEYEVEESHIGIVDADGNDVPVHGFVDMILKDKAGNNVIFDLKWTSLPKFYSGKLVTSTAYQLDLYSAMLREREQRMVSKVGYFVMPNGVLYTCNAFAGKHISHIQPDLSNGNALSKLKATFKQQRGLIKDGQITYKDADGNNLKSNFSKYTLLYIKEK